MSEGREIDATKCAVICLVCGAVWQPGMEKCGCNPKPAAPSYAYLERLVLEVRERLERLEKRMERMKESE